MAGQSRRKQEMLMKKAKELFFIYGYEGVSMDRIASEAGISKMTIYKYCDSKEKLFSEVIIKDIQNYMDEAQRLMDEKYHTVDKIGALYEYSKEVAKRYPPVLLKDIVKRKSMLDKFTKVKQELVVSLWRYILEDGVSKGEIRNIDVEFVAGLLMNLPAAIKNYDFLDNEVKLMKFYENFMDFIKYGLLGGLEVVNNAEGRAHDSPECQ